MPFAISPSDSRFQSTPSARRATAAASAWQTAAAYFNPRPPRGGRRFAGAPAAISARNFNPRPPRGGRLPTHHNDSIHHKFQSTPSARRATSKSGRAPILQTISIHALREEGDFMDDLKAICQQDFNPRPPRGGRPGNIFNIIQTKNISIHALREEGDTNCLNCQRSGSKFQSTPSARRATRDTKGKRQAETISIHALREEGDRLRPCKRNRETDFNPRPPRGGRR